MARCVLLLSALLLALAASTQAYSAAAGLATMAAKKLGGSILPFENGYNLVAAADSYATSVNYFSATWTVPNFPKHRNSTFFLGLKLQSITVVEGFMALLLFNRNYYSLVTYANDGSGYQYTNFSSTNVYPGDLIAAEIEWDYSNRVWNVSIQDVYTGASTSQSMVNPLTLGIAEVVLATNQYAKVCQGLPYQTAVNVTGIMSSCSWPGCGPWTNSLINDCLLRVVSSSSQIDFYYDPVFNNSNTA